MKFEYKVDTCWGDVKEHQEYLNRNGLDGWELINISGDSSTFVTYIFKRLIN